MAVLKLQIKASEAQNLALRKIDMDLLNKAINQLEQLHTEMTELDKNREIIQLQLENDLEIKQGSTVSDILPKLPISMQDKLKELQQQIQLNYQKLAHLNELNNLLTKRAQQVNSAILNLFTNGAGNKTYRNSGTLNKNKSTGVINKTV